MKVFLLGVESTDYNWNINFYSESDTLVEEAVLITTQPTFITKKNNALREGIV